jgi:protease-4
MTQTVSTKKLILTVVIYVVVITAALVGGYFLAQAAIPAPKIAVLYLDMEVGTLLSEIMSRQVDYAINAPDIKGVVLVVNSPGGSASAGQDIYLQIRQLRAKKPVVTSVDIGAFSAAYQISVAATKIYAKQPGVDVLSEDYTTTGPYKSIGASATGILQKQDLIFNDFRDTVVAERSAAPNPLKISREQLSTGEIWVGIEAMEYGLIDALGSKLDATDEAARLAGLRNYKVVDLWEEYVSSLGEGEAGTTTKLLEELKNQPKFDMSSHQERWPSFYEIYIPLE